MKKPSVDEVVAAAWTGKRSPLYRWLWDDYDEIAKRLPAHGANWEAIAELAIKNGITDARGNPPRAETVRQAWHRVKTDKKGRSTPKPKPALSAVTETKTFKLARKRPHVED